ncbi:MAG TPA: class I SAM-dependent methyltransferase [Parvibaculum sp.]
MNAPKLFSSGDDYELQMGRWSRPVGEQFVDWLKVPEGMRWVDVGCGNGAFSQVIMKRARPSAVAGVDFSEGQIDYARKHVGAANAQFEVGDAQSLPFADGSFDVAAMALVIAFVPDTARAVAEMKRVTRPGGWVGTYMWDMMAGGVPVHPVYEALRRMGYDPALPPRAEASHREAMQGFWQKAGLEDVETTVIRITVVHPNFESFWDSNSRPSGPQGVVLSKMAPDEKEKVQATLRDILPIAADGSIRYAAFANAVKGRVPR